MSRALGASKMHWLRLAEALLLPPGCLLLLTFLGLVLLQRRRTVAGTALLAASLLSLYLLATPWVAGLLLGSLDRYPEIPPTELAARAEAVVVLGAGIEDGSTDPGAPLSDDSVERLVYGAQLSRRLGLPLLISGRQIQDSGTALLAERFDLAPRWVEGDSRNTRDNARFSAHLIASSGVRRVYLVTHFYHQPRAVVAFESVGMEVVPAPMGFSPPASSEPRMAAAVPRLRSLRLSAVAMHELFGRLWYRLRYRI